MGFLRNISSIVSRFIHGRPELPPTPLLPQKAEKKVPEPADPTSEFERILKQFRNTNANMPDLDPLLAQAQSCLTRIEKMPDRAKMHHEYIGILWDIAHDLVLSNHDHEAIQIWTLIRLTTGQANKEVVRLAHRIAAKPANDRLSIQKDLLLETLLIALESLYVLRDGANRQIASEIRVLLDPLRIDWSQPACSELADRLAILGELRPVAKHVQDVSVDFDFWYTMGQWRRSRAIDAPELYKSFDKLSSFTPSCQVYRWCRFRVAREIANNDGHWNIPGDCRTWAQSHGDTIERLASYADALKEAEQLCGLRVTGANAAKDVDRVRSTLADPPILLRTLPELHHHTQPVYEQLGMKPPLLDHRP